MSVNFDNIPDELRARAKWVLWRWEQRADRTTGELKLTKPPYQPNGVKAESDNPNTWVRYEYAKSAYESGGFDGVGYVVTLDKEPTDGHPGTEDDGIVGVDLDHCVDIETGAVLPWAQSIVDKLNSYTDVTPSDTGLRIFVHAKLPAEGRKQGNFECYEWGRFLTITGNHLPGTPTTIENRQDELNSVHAEMFAERNKKRSKQGPPPKAAAVDLEDDALLEVAFAAKNGDAVRRLYHGDTGQHGSHSEADLALCSHLAFYTAGDAARMDRMFRASDLYRPKWDDQRGSQTYGEMTVAKALDGVTEHYTGHNNGHQATDSNSVYSVDSVYGWENPQPFASVEVPSFPVDTLPTDLVNYVSQEAEAKQVPLDLPGCLVLGATAAAVAGKCRVSLTYDWSEPLNNYLVSVLPSGERKSPVFREIFKPMEQQERELVATKAPEILTAQTEREILEKRWQNAKNEAAKRGPQADSMVAEADARDLAEQLAKFVVPPVPRLLADDATPEAVAGLLAEQKGRLAIVSTEGGIFDIIAGRYSENVANLDVYLKGYSGDTIRVDRRSRPAEFIADPCLTMVLTVQPDVIRDLAGKQAFRGRGFLARWLYSLPNSKVGFRDTNAPTVLPEVRAKWEQTQFAILQLPYPGDIGTPLIRLSRGADKEFQAFRGEVEADLRPGGGLGDLADWGNKLCGNVARLAGLLHALHCANGSAYPWDSRISPETMADAITLGKYFKEHAKAAFALMGTDGRLVDAKRVWATIVRDEMENFTVRDLWQKVRRSFSKVTDLEGVLNLLVDLGYIRAAVPPKREGPGQPPSPRYEVNPKARTQNTQSTQNTAGDEVRV